MLFMPRAFREDERSRIESRLVETGRVLFERQGLRKTNVAELARAAGIGKGSFYLFYPTKEALFLAISDRFEADLKAEFVRELDRMRRSGASVRALLSRYFELHFEVFERHPFLALLTDPLTGRKQWLAACRRHQEWFDARAVANRAALGEVEDVAIP